ncbi:MAG: hypothetical protein E7400_00020 [Ruminococcaceae bacterium]|nr:hypothetical protein [Oscillospiraceae bacterium]
MQIYHTIYKKENMLQCSFSDNFIHPDYIGAEFPIGQHLITAITYNREKVEGFFKDLVKAYIAYLDCDTDKNFHTYEKALFKIDDYCIYLHEISYMLVSLMQAVHPRYSLGGIMDFIKLFEPDTITVFTKQLARVKNGGSFDTKECHILWNLAASLLLDKFDSDIQMLKSDVYDICNAPSELTGFNKLTDLENPRKIFYLGLKFPTQLSVDLGEATNSKFLLSNLSENGNITLSVSISSTLQLLYYDLLVTLENDLPIKLCKNCHTPFIPKGRIDSVYCDRVMLGFKDKCASIGALNTYKNKLPDIEAEFYAARRRYNTRVSRNPLLKTEFEVWKIKAKEKLTAYRNDEISADEFKDWFMDDEWMRI